MYPYVKAAKIAGAKHTLKGGLLILNGKKYTTATAKNIPKTFQPSQNAARNGDNLIIFHRSDSPFSNFYPPKFKIEDNEYDQNEQLYQSKKADHFKHVGLAAKICVSSSALDCMKLGKRVKSYNEAEWARVEQKVMFDGVLAKFAQNPDLKEILKATGTKKLAESSGDRKWATGLPMYHPNALDS